MTYNVFSRTLSPIQSITLNVYQLNEKNGCSFLVKNKKMTVDTRSS